MNAVRRTRVQKAGRALLSKRITLGDDGRPVSDGAPCAMSCGGATRVVLDSSAPTTALAALILDLGSHEALVLGDHAADTDRVEITKAAHADPSKGRYGRTLQTFRFRDGEPAVLLLDYDQKGISDRARPQGRAVVAASTQGQLSWWEVLHFDDQTLGEVSSPTSSPIQNDSTTGPWPTRSRAGTTVAAKRNCSGIPTTRSS